LFSQAENDQRKGYNIKAGNVFMTKRTMPVCMTPEQYEKLAKIAKMNGMVDVGQAAEKLLKEI
jgi:hypothetical protein